MPERAPRTRFLSNELFVLPLFPLPLPVLLGLPELVDHKGDPVGQLHSGDAGGSGDTGEPRAAGGSPARPLQPRGVTSAPAAPAGGAPTLHPPAHEKGFWRPSITTPQTLAVWPQPFGWWGSSRCKGSWTPLPPPPQLPQTPMRCTHWKQSCSPATLFRYCFSELQNSPRCLCDTVISSRTRSRYCRAPRNTAARETRGPG